MTHFNVSVPEDKVIFFNELLKNLSFAKLEQPESIGLTEAHKAIIDQRLNNYQNNPDSYLDWEEEQKNIEKRL
ncbi:MAG: hypothetical protein DRJ05_20110 [Bacteroidetes bacterium]|nr:MAG: hypothetical protein DRJ05_20110 [Bacteroidota bacterium]